MNARAACVALMAILTTVSISRAVASPAAEVPAVWTAHAMIIDLDGLSKRYSCDDLWYRFRAVLLSIGARPDLRVVPYHCEERTPSVELQFSLPRSVPASFADLQAERDIITLGPGQPAPLDLSDCALMRQIKDALFNELPLRVVNFRLACLGPQSSRHHFQVTLQSLRPDSQPRATVAASATPSSGAAAAVAVAAAKNHS